MITDTLDPNLDLSTFQLTEIAFGDTVLAIPPGSQDYRTTVPMTYNGVTFDVLVTASLDYATRLLTVEFQSIDPQTQLPPNILAGFLPPENGTGRGQGYVSYLIAPKAGLPTGTPITNVADITFDVNAPIATDQVSETDASQGISTAKQALVTIDNSTPTSSVAALPATENSTDFHLSWSGSDGGGSGIAKYSVLYSTEAKGSSTFGPYQTLLVDTTETSTTFPGQAGASYRFYSVATSNIGSVQPTPTSPQATTTVSPTATPTPTPTTPTPTPTTPTPTPTTPTPTPTPTTPTPTPTTPTPTPTPPPLVTVTGIQLERNKMKQVTEVIVTFSGALNAAEADSVANYRLATPGKKGSYTAKNAGIIKLNSATFNGSDNEVILVPKKPFALTKKVQFLIEGASPSGLHDAQGRAIDGDHNGTPGGNGVAYLSKGGASLEALVSGAGQRPGASGGGVSLDALLDGPGGSSAPDPAAVDALVELDAIAALVPPQWKRRKP